jgi:hypothetical protein
MTTPTVTHCATLQGPDDYGAPPSLTAHLRKEGSATVVDLRQEGPGGESVTLTLTYKAWARLAEMWIAREPDAAWRRCTRLRQERAV